MQKNVSNTDIIPDKHRHSKGKVNYRKLPPPLAVLQMLRLDKGRLNSAGYWVIYCPIHKCGKEKNPSLNVHQIDGHFRCHTCGIKGGDIAKFYALVMNVSYKQAAKHLRAWEDTI